MAPTPNKSTTQTIRDTTLNGLANLIRLLPTGTVFLFQFLNPVLTNNGNCSTTNKYLTGIFLGVCGFSCCFSCFTDSYVDNDGALHYSIATKTGFWPTSGPGDYSRYKICIGDFIHAFFSLLVFGVVVLLDPNTVECYYSSFQSTQKTLLMVLPPAVGVISSSVFVMFPNKRHGIGYAPTQATQVSPSA